MDKGVEEGRVKAARNDRIALRESTGVKREMFDDNVPCHVPN